MIPRVNKWISAYRNVNRNRVAGPGGAYPAWKFPREAMTAPKNTSVTFVSPLGLQLLLDPEDSAVLGHGGGGSAGGAERQFMLFGLGLRKQGWSVGYITDNVPACAGRATTMPVQRARFGFLHGRKYGFLLDSLSILYAMWRADSFYYVIKTPAYLLVPMKLFTWLFRRKLVFWAQMEFDAWPQLRPHKRIPGLLQGIGTRFADILLAQNNSQVEGFRRNFRKHAFLIRNIAGSLSEDPIPAHADKPPVDILWVGNSMAKKRVEIVLALARRLPEYTFAIAMNRADAGRYEVASRQCSLLGNVSFLGEVEPAAMEAWFGRARLLLNTSRQEGFPNTYLQAWQHDIPVISVCIDPDGVVARHGLGAVLDSRLEAALDGDEDRYAARLEPLVLQFLDDETHHQEYAARVRRYIDDHHDADLLVGQLIGILQAG